MRFEAGVYAAWKEEGVEVRLFQTFVLLFIFLFVKNSQHSHGIFSKPTTEFIQVNVKLSSYIYAHLVLVFSNSRILRLVLTLKVIETSNSHF